MNKNDQEDNESINKNDQEDNENKKDEIIEPKNKKLKF
jgi:hypothetical protein